MSKEELEAEYHKIRAEFFENDNCMHDFLGATKVPAGMTYEEAFEMYIRLRKWADKDQFFIDRDDGMGLVELLE